MSQIYKVFSNNHVFCLLEEDSFCDKLEKFYKANSINHFIELMKDSLRNTENKTLENTFIVFFSKKLKIDWAKLIQSFYFIEAAGGLVRNSENNYLFILKNNCWDLPKGKIDIGEKHEHAAIREIKEETNLHDLFLEKSLTCTYHLYLDKNTILKKTKWYLVRANKTNNLSPQIDEGITELKWFSKKEFPESYLSLNEVLKMVID